MKIVKWIAIVVGALAMAFLIGGMLMPSSVRVSKQTVINAPADKIYPHIADLRAFNAWAPWTKQDPAMKVTYSGPQSGAGQKASWVSEKMGSGSQTITAVDENASVSTALDFGAMGTAKARFILETDGAATRVTWSMDADLGDSLVSRWFGPMIRSGVSKDYERGLADLKTLVEGQ